MEYDIRKLYSNYGVLDGVIGVFLPNKNAESCDLGYNIGVLKTDFGIIMVNKGKLNNKKFIEFIGYCDGFREIIENYRLDSSEKFGMSYSRGYFLGRVEKAIINAYETKR